MGDAAEIPAVHLLYISVMSTCRRRGARQRVRQSSEFEYPVFKSYFKWRGEGRTRRVGENGVWQLDSGRRVLRKKRGGIGAYSAKHCHSLNGALSQ